MKAPPSGPDWVHELKYDGYRIHARLERRRARLLTRTGLDWADRYEATAEAVSAVAAQAAYLDGELCAVRPDGTTSFPEMQAATDGRRTTGLPAASHLENAARHAATTHEPIRIATRSFPPALGAPKLGMRSQVPYLDRRRVAAASRIRRAASG
jgi:ATP dependent DNA ligase-like protein